MKAQSLGLKVASVIFMCVALAHAARLVFGWQITIGSYSLGTWPGAAVAVAAFALSIWMGMLACCDKAEAPPPQKT
jgi:hypothetical protein